MVLLTREHFVSTIDAIRMQLHKDYAYADAVSSLFNTDSIGPYDNSLLVKQLISLLQMYFPRDKEGFCDIEHYCFELNFGKCSDQELITAEDLYYRLISKEDIAESKDLKPNISVNFSNELRTVVDALGNEHLVSTHPLIDDYPFKKDIDGEKEH